MSDMTPWLQAARVSSLAAPAPGAFTAWGRLPSSFAAPAAMADEGVILLGSDVNEDGGNHDGEDDAILDPATIHDAAFAAGHAEGLAMLERAILDERAAVASLAASLAALEPEPAGPLALLLAHTVERLVRQVMGEVDIDAARLSERAHAAAALIAEEAAPSRMRVHPTDLERLAGAALPLDVVADPAIAPGSVSVEGADGWVEDGPAAALDRLSGMLDRMGVVA